MNTFESIFTNENAEKTAQIIIERIHSKGTQVDYDFHFQQGKFVSNDINTWIKFDTDNDQLLKDILDVLTNEEIEPTKERIKLFSDFRNKVCEVLANELKEELADKLRDYVFGGKMNKSTCPMNDIKVTNFEITDVPESGRYLLVVKKEQPRDEISQSVTNELYEYLRHLEDEEKLDIEKMSAKMDEFIKEKKEEGNEKFRYIKSVKMKRAFFECQIDMFADYSIVIPEEAMN